MNIRRRYLSLTQIRGYNSHPGLYINGKLKGHWFIGICHGVEIDKNNTCLILSVLCKYFKYINLLGLSRLGGICQVACNWAECCLNKVKYCIVPNISSNMLMIINIKCICIYIYIKLPNCTKKMN